MTAVSTKPTSKVRSPAQLTLVGTQATNMGYWLANSQIDTPAPIAIAAGPQDHVAEDDREPRRDPVGDDQQEVVVLINPAQPGPGEEEADGPEAEGHDRPPDVQRKLEAEGVERQRPRVDVDGVRRDCPDRDGQQREVGEPGRQGTGERGRRVAVGADDLEDAGDGPGGGADGLQQDAGQEDAKSGPQADGLLARVRLHVAGEIGR